MREFDAIVIGAGSGLDIASVYASHDKNVAVIEPGPMGGTCLNRGCIPSKMLIHHADLLQEVRGSDKFHIDAEVNSIDYPEIIREVNSTVSEDAEKIENAIEKSENHTLYKAKAKFVDEKVVEVDGEKITADEIYVAAGSRPLVPPVEGLKDVDYLTSKEALQLEERPDQMVIIGGGYIACELAHFFDAVGVKVTIIEMGDSLLGREDEEVSELFTDKSRDRYDVNLGLKATEIEEVGGKLKVKAEDKEGNIHSFAGDELLVAAGRVPNSDSLDVEESGIETDERGFIKTNSKLETNVDGVYAIGDIADNFMFKHSANYEAEVAVRNGFADHQMEADYTAMPHAVFSSPQIAGVGKTEQQLKDGDIDYVKATYDYSKTGMGLALKEEDGFVKILASEGGEILGCHIIGPEASTLIHEVLVPVRNGLGVHALKETIHIHPALSEVVARAFNKL